MGLPNEPTLHNIVKEGQTHETQLRETSVLSAWRNLFASDVANVSSHHLPKTIGFTDRRSFNNSARPPRETTMPSRRRDAGVRQGTDNKVRMRDKSAACNDALLQEGQALPQILAWIRKSRTLSPGLFATLAKILRPYQGQLHKLGHCENQRLLRAMVRRAPHALLGRRLCSCVV